MLKVIADYKIIGATHWQGVAFVLPSFLMVLVLGYGLNYHGLP